MTQHGLPGGGTSLAWLLLAAGLLVAVLPDATRCRVRWLSRAEPDGAAIRRIRRLGEGLRRRDKVAALADADALLLAASWDLLAAGLRAGMPVPAAVRACANTAPTRIQRVLLATADLLAFGADPAQAWQQARACEQTAEFARAACRTARSGAALADIATDLADRARAAAGERAKVRAQRAGVLMTGPLGLCFLPAFLCLGVIPVVLGLASQLTVLR